MRFACVFGGGDNGVVAERVEPMVTDAEDTYSFLWKPPLLL